MLEPASWLPAAQSLTLGQTQRTGHDCGEGSPLIVEHKDRGWSAWCHRCNDKGWVPKPAPTLAERYAQQEAQRLAELALRDSPALPSPLDFNVKEWPLEARVWLFKSGLFYEDIKNLGAYYHPMSRRVVLPVMRGEDVLYWQARDVGLCRFGAPKYLNSKTDRTDIVYQRGEGSEIVLTEDILSAYRVSLHTEAWSLLGTRLQDSSLSRLVRDGRPVMVWLDDDKRRGNPGQIGAAKIIRVLELAGVACTNIVTPREPKQMTRAEVEQTLNHHRRLL